MNFILLFPLPFVFPYLQFCLLYGILTTTTTTTTTREGVTVEGAVGRTIEDRVSFLILLDIILEGAILDMAQGLSMVIIVMNALCQN